VSDLHASTLRQREPTVAELSVHYRRDFYACSRVSERNGGRAGEGSCRELRRFFSPLDSWRPTFQYNAIITRRRIESRYRGISFRARERDPPRLSSRRHSPLPQRDTALHLRAVRRCREHPPTCRLFIQPGILKCYLRFQGTRSLCERARSRTAFVR